MKSQKKLYIAGTGMITAIGGNTSTTVAAVNAKISAYSLSKHENDKGEAITMALVPEVLFDEIELATALELDQGDCYNTRHDHITIMAVLALQEACSHQQTKQAVPLLMAMSEYSFDQTDLSSLSQNLEANVSPWINDKLNTRVYSGRAAGIEAIDIIFKHLYNTPYDYFLVGGSDSYLDADLMANLNKEKRLLSPSTNSAFAPGEGAGYLLLTRDPELALVDNNHIIALCPPGVADEPGHIGSNEPYRGDGLDKAFKKALINHQQQNIDTIFSSMNGEHFWAKELGVAQLRNNKAFSPSLNILHPAEYYGDLGAATASIQIILAAHHLWQNNQAQADLVYSSSDAAKRGAIVLEKIPAPTPTNSIK